MLNRNAFLALVAWVPFLAAAQAVIPSTADPAWTVVQSRSALEILPELRVEVDAHHSSRAVPLRVRRASASDANIGNGSRGVLFNHAMQSYGSMTGEISFRVESGNDGGQAAQKVGLQQIQRIGLSDYWVGRAASPQALRDALASLQTMPGVLEARWVVNYDLPRKPLDNARAIQR
jgi:hypothetical protein